MRLLFVSVRYGSEFGGGAEGSCRLFATQLAARGHEVHVLTTRARDYQTWADDYPETETVLDSVHVHRLSVSRPRDLGRFGRLNGRVAWRSHPGSLLVQEAWMRAQGPCPDDFDDWLLTNSRDFDAVSFFTYLYYPTWRGLQLCHGRAPTILHATAHDEPYFWLPIYDEVLRLPTSYAYFTEEERDLVTRRTGSERPGEVIGIGTDFSPQGDNERFREKWGLGDRPYLLYVGRLDPSKGVPELHDFFEAYKERRPGPLALVLMGDRVLQFDERPDLIMTGFVDDQTKQDALAGCEALVLPSYYESFSMALSEAWVHRRPVLVQGYADVLVGQVRRSGGGLPYKGYAEFEATLDLMLESPGIGEELGNRGRSYLEAYLTWDQVIGRYEALLHDTIRRRIISARRLPRPASPLSAKATGWDNLSNMSELHLPPQAVTVPVAQTSPSDRAGEIYAQLLKERIVFLGTPVEDASANLICAQLLLLAAEDPARDISLYINSPGGSVTAGLAIYDTMQFISCDVSTYCMGLAASMGQFLLCAGAPGKRYALPHSRILMHQPSGQAQGQAADIAIQAEQIVYLKRMMAERIAFHTGQSVERIETDSDRDRWFTAEEAQEYGFIDHVISRATQITEPAAR